MKKKLEQSLDIHARQATLKLKLKAQSGYVADVTGKISADQWGRILAIVEEPLPEPPQAA